MWRVEDDQGDDRDGGGSGVSTAVPSNATMPQNLSMGDPSVSVANIAEPVWEAWRSRLSAAGGDSTLLHFRDAPRTRIELSTTHPGGLAQFITGKTTLLSSLIRDDLALRTARVAASEIAAKGLELSTVRGIDSIHLAIGMAQWVFSGETFRAPVLLRPLAIRRHGRDFEVKLLGKPSLNPALADALHDQFGITLDASAFVSLADREGSFTPNPVIDRLRGLTAHLDGFTVQPRLVVSSFAEIGPAMVADARELSHPVLDALAGNPTSRAQITSAFRPVTPTPQDERSPETDTLLLDADSEQENVVAQITAGNSVVVKTLPGTGGTQTIVNTIGTLVGQNKRVLVVSARRATLRGISARLTEIGLPGVAVSPTTLRRDVIKAIGRNEKAKQAGMAEVDDALVRLRRVLVDYRTALSREDPVLHVSVLDCLTELARLALLPAAPATTARLSRHSVESMVEGRGRVAETMVNAANLGEFRYGPGDSPWYGARFDDGGDPGRVTAGQAHQLAKNLFHRDVPHLIERATEVVGSTRMRPFVNITELGIYLRLLADVRDTLDKFLPVVFERSVTELIDATSNHREGDMSGSTRRRLKKLAREYVRPGMHVADIHEALKKVQHQRILWQRYVAAGTPPEVPTGVTDALSLYRQVSDDLAQLDRPLGLTGEDLLEEIGIDELQQKLEVLAAESDVLNNLQERTELMTTLRDLELAPLITDLANRHVPEAQVAAELELAWWRSALESLLEADRALLGANTGMLDRLEADFRLVDEAHAAGSAQSLGWQLAENWKLGLVDWPEEAAQLKQLLRHDHVTGRLLQDAAPHLARAVAPVWIASPYEVHAIADTVPFDTVILVDAGATTLAENVGAIRRGRQTVAFGDPVTETPSDFSIAVPPFVIDDAPVAKKKPSETQNADEHASDDGFDPVATAESRLSELHEESALARLSTILPTLSLTRSYRAGGEDLSELVNRRFYGGRIESLPWAGSFLGHGSISLDYVSGGTAVPDPESGAVESVEAEVERVVALVLEHARTRPTESLMVITASPKHAIRVQQAVLTAVSGNKDLTEFVVGDRREPFMVATLEQSVAQSRDHVIFSIGYGRTPHGRVLSDFGSLGQPGGERLLAVAMTRARRSMVIVTCFQPTDIDASRMGHGTVALSEILTEVQVRTTAEHIPDDSDPMLVDLARRLEAKGIPVALGHRGKLGLVCANDGVCVTIETDSTLVTSSLRDSLRARPEILRRLGWHYVRVHAFQLFTDPDAVATRIAEVLGIGATHTREIPTVSALSHVNHG